MASLGVTETPDQEPAPGQSYEGQAPTTFAELRRLWEADLYRLEGQTSAAAHVKHFLLTPGFAYMFYLRLSVYLSAKRGAGRLAYFAARVLLRRQTYRLGIIIPYDTQIGPGFYIGHFGEIVVNADVRIGRNCNISQGVTLGLKARGKNAGSPVIGDNVYIGPGAKVIGGVRVGDNVAIGANCVVTSDVPDNAVVVGVPGRVISSAGSEGYINYAV
ncbi:MAG: serine acetyltransferase [Solirubrobacterales bacterium]|nr:serine acetyltransferase [Solirubrobacterales bacterium]